VKAIVSIVLERTMQTHYSRTLFVYNLPILINCLLSAFHTLHLTLLAI
jgi:hypothetical protein